MKVATRAITKQEKLFNELCKAVGSKNVEEWGNHIVAWQKDHDVKPDPFQEIGKGHSSRAISYYLS